MPSKRILITLWAVLFGVLILVYHGPFEAGQKQPLSGKPHSALTAFAANCVLLALLLYASCDIVRQILRGGALYLRGSGKQILSLDSDKVHRIGNVKLGKHTAIEVCLDLREPGDQVIKAEVMLIDKACRDADNGLIAVRRITVAYEEEQCKILKPLRSRAQVDVAVRLCAKPSSQVLIVARWHVTLALLPRPKHGPEKVSGRFF